MLLAGVTNTIERDRSGSAIGTLVLSFLLLGIANLTVKEFLPSPIYALIGAVMVAFIATAWVLLKKDYFQFLLSIFVCNHFVFVDDYGGLWSYVVCSVLFVGFVFIGPSFKLSSIPKSISVLVVILLCHQFLGIIFNPYSNVSKIEAVIMSLSQVLVLFCFASQTMTPNRLKQFISVWYAVACWCFIAALNQKYTWLVTPSPLLPQRYLSGELFAAAPSGTFGVNELFGEYFCLVFVLSMVIITHLKELADLKLNKIVVVILVFVSIGAIILSSARAALILAALGSVYLLVFNFFVAPSLRNLLRTVMLSAILVIIVAIVLVFSSILSLDRMVSDFKDLRSSQISTDSVISGNGINRGDVYAPALKQLKQGSWWVGYGYNVQELNRESMGLKGKLLKDFHSLYLTIPFFYGWIGSAALVLIVLVSGLRVYTLYLMNSKMPSVLVPFALGFAIIWGLFLIDEYKITATRNPSYFLLIWMLLGWTHAVANSIDNKLNITVP